MNLLYDNGLHGTLELNEFNEDTPLLKQIVHIYMYDSSQPSKIISSTP